MPCLEPELARPRGWSWGCVQGCGAKFRVALPSVLCPGLSSLLAATPCKHAWWRAFTPRLAFLTTRVYCRLSRRASTPGGAQDEGCTSAI